MKIDYSCVDCKVSGVKLWREYANFLDHSYPRCLECAERKQGLKLDERTKAIGWLVPAVLTVDGDTYWGYTSTPPDRMLWWENLPVSKADEYGPLGVSDCD